MRKVNLGHFCVLVNFWVLNFDLWNHNHKTMKNKTRTFLESSSTIFNQFEEIVEQVWNIDIQVFERLCERLNGSEFSGHYWFFGQFQFFGHLIICKLLIFWIVDFLDTIDFLFTLNFLDTWCSILNHIEPNWIIWPFFLITAQHCVLSSFAELIVWHKMEEEEEQLLYLLRMLCH